MAELLIANKEDLVNIADAIREKTGLVLPLSLTELPELISEFQGAGPFKQVLTGTFTTTGSSFSSFYYPEDLEGKPVAAIFYQEEQINGIYTTVYTITTAFAEDNEGNILSYGFSCNSLYEYYDEDRFSNIGYPRIKQDSIGMLNENNVSILERYTTYNYILITMDERIIYIPGSTGGGSN